MQDILRSQFRLPIDLADQLKGASEANNRSLNAEIVARLQMSFRQEGEALSSFNTGDLIEELLKRYPKERITITIGE